LILSFDSWIMLGMRMEPELPAGEAGHLLRALERLEKLLVAAEAERMIPHHHQLMDEARFLGLAIGCRVMQLAGGAATVRDEWRQPSEPDGEIRDQVELDALLDLAKNTVMTEAQKEEQRRSWIFGSTNLSNPAIMRRMVDDAADGMPNPEDPG
jgi:hypothetical protein